MNATDNTAGVARQLFSRVGDMAASRVFRELMRQAATEILTNPRGSELQTMIVEDYPLIEEELPDDAKNVLRNVGPRYESVIYSELRSENVLEWLGEPETWHDDEATQVSLKRCHDVITNTPGGEQWLDEQLIVLGRICLNYPTGSSD